MSDSRQTLIAILRTQLISVQQQNRFIARAYETSLSLSESHVLVELDAAPSASPADLSRALGISRTAVSRIVSGLTRKMLVKVNTRAEDRRSVSLSITSAGKRILATMDKNANSLMEGLAARLSDSEGRRFCALFERMNDGYHAPPAAARPHDHPLLQQGRRQTRGMKFLGKDAFGAGTLSVFDWHILLKLSHSSGGLNPSELARFFTAPTNTMSSALLRLERQKLIKRQKVMTDGRLSLVTLADAGFEALQHIEDVVTKLLTESLSDFSNEELADFVALFVRFAGSAAESEVVLQPRLTMRTLEDEEERLDARAFLVEQLVRTGHARSVRERVIAKDSFTWTLMADGEVKGVCEFGEIGAKAYLLHFTLSQPLQNSTAEETFLRAGLARFLDKSSAREVVVSDIHMDSTLLTRLKAETRNGETILSRIAI